MHLEVKKSGRFRKAFANVWQNKKLAIPVFTLMIAGLGFGIYSAVRAITSAGDATTISVANNYRGYTYDSNAIYYGLNNDPNYKPWSTRWYNVNGNDAMCLQASRSTPTGSGTAAINTSNVKNIMLATVPSYSDASVAAGGPNYYNLFSAQYDWSSKAQSITHLITGSSTLSYGGRCSSPASDPRASYSPTCADQEEKTKYTDYYYGCSNYYSTSCVKDAAHSLVDMRDAIFAIGHMAASGVYANDYFALNSSDISVVQGVASDINNWFAANYPNAADEFESYTTWVDATHQTVGWLEYKGPSTYSVRIRKVSSANTSTGLSGAAFRVCEIGDNDSDENCQGPFTTGSTGYTQYITVGSTKIRWYEVTYPSGYTCQSPLSTQGTYGYCYGAEVISNGDTVVVENTPVPTAYIKIKKLISGQNSVSYAGLTIQGTVFSVKNSSNTEVATITIGSDGTGTTNTALPVGTYTISEKTATTGFSTNSATLTVTLNSGNTATNPATVDMSTSTTACSSGSSPCTFYNNIIEGEFSLTKTGYEMTAAGAAGTRNLAGITFTAVNKSNSAITYTVGPTDSNGAATSPNMIYGTYTVTEVRGNSNNAYDLISFDVTINGTGTVAAGTKNDTIPDTPGLVTVARNSNSTADSPDKELEISPNASVTDRVTCSGLQSGAQYKLEGTLYKVSGSTTVGSTGASTFTADSSGTCGNLDMVFTSFDTSSYIDQTLGIVQVLYKNNGTSSSPDWVRIFIHNANLQDTNEQVKVKNVQIETTATSTRADNKVVAAGTVTVNDAIQIIGLTSGQSYTLEGALKDPSGNIVATSSANYTMSAATGATVTTSLSFSFNSTAYIGQSLSVTVTLKNSSGATIATHVGTANNGETVSVLTPEIATTAVNGRDTSIKEVEVGNTTIQDTISFTGLVSGDVYRLEGKLIDESGAEIGSANKDFTASGETGSATVTFNVDTSAYVGKKIIVYEYLYYGNNKIAEHAELTDGDQTVTVKTPTVGTTAVDNADGDKFVEVDEGIKIKDTVAYDGLVPNDSYTLVMKVVKRSDPSVEIATGTKDFQASGVSGTVDVVSAAFDSTTLHDSNLVGLDLVVFEYLYHGSTQIGKHEDKDDTAQIITVKTPTISTIAYDVQNRTRELPLGTTTVIDEVSYTNLVNGKTYTLKGTLVNASGTPIQDNSGADITGTATFTADATGKTDLTFSFFDTVLMFDYNASTQPVFIAFDELYKNNVLIAEHKDAADADQTIPIGRPKIHTTATWKVADDMTQDSNMLGVGDVIMKDYIEYEGLVEGEWYTVVASIYNPETNSVLEIDDESVENSKTFKADSKGKGTVAIEINLNTVSLQGKSFVVYERLYRAESKHGDGRLLDVHEEALNEGTQTFTVKVASIGTVAKDKADGDNVIDHENGQTIIDTVHYDGLLMDEQYTLYGYLWDKTNNKPLLDSDGNRIESYSTFTTPRRSDNGDVTIEFPVDAYDFPGIEIVVFEYLFAGDQSSIPTDSDGNPDTTQVVTKHEDPEDADQTVRVSMRVGTQAVDAYDNDQIIGVGNVQVIDHLKYEGVTMGKTYKAKGWLVRKSTGEAIPGIEGEKTFMVGEEGYAETTGAVEITFEFDSREYIGEQLVVFEELYLIDEEGNEELVAEHKDLEDADQTITVADPEIHTTAVDKSDSDKELMNDIEAVITDKVEYSGLVAGTSYTLHGYLVSKTTGERMTASGITEVTYTFIATRDAGTETIEFTIDTTGLSGKEIVVFETLYIDDEPVEPVEPEEGEEPTEEEVPALKEENIIADHKDLNDNNQTVWVKVTTPNTGLFTRLLDGAKQNGLFIIVPAITLVSFGAWGAYRLKSRRKIGF
ncbi:VaFE repeat-containing surface-anchored protein [Candidatus Saccharibacteria bacterium]|nr:VaFE repeat-containing surface-anchored protein [Candidatus Saccharibacteria bacterium]